MEHAIGSLSLLWKHRASLWRRAMSSLGLKRWFLWAVGGGYEFSWERFSGFPGQSVRPKEIG